MKTHESPASRNGSKGQQRRGSEQIMQVHETAAKSGQAWRGYERAL